MPEIHNLAELVEEFSVDGTELYTNGDYILRRFRSGQAYKPEPAAIRIDGLSVVLCTGGEGTVTVNFKTVELSAGCIVVLSPNDLVGLPETGLSNIEGYALFLPVEFLKLISLDSSTLNYRDIRLDASPVMHLDGDRLRFIEGYYEMLKFNTTVNRDETVYTRNVSRSLVGALIYQLLAIFRESSDKEKAAESETTAPAGRRQYYVRDFMNLLQQDFRQHRSVGHYADRLFISAKYLSLIIKEATGRTATEWIDHFVILEAKNLLRYSGRNIQQIAYDLNFHNQSAFGKYFKHLTGLSPSEFRKS